MYYMLTVLTLHVLHAYSFNPVLLTPFALKKIFWLSDNEQLARSGTNCLENLSVSVGTHFNLETWDKVVQCAKDIFTLSLPHQLLSWQPDETLMRRSYSTLSVGSTRSSLTSTLPPEVALFIHIIRTCSYIHVYMLITVHYIHTYNVHTCTYT